MDSLGINPAQLPASQQQQPRSGDPRKPRLPLLLLLGLLASRGGTAHNPSPALLHPVPSWFLQGVGPGPGWPRGVARRPHTAACSTRSSVCRLLFVVEPTRLWSCWCSTCRPVFWRHYRCQQLGRWTRYCFSPALCDSRSLRRLQITSGTVLQHPRKADEISLFQTSCTGSN